MIRSAEGVDAVVDQADKAGEVEVLICNVGIYGVKAFEEITDEEWIKYYEVRVEALRCTSCLTATWLHVKAPGASKSHPRP